MQLNIPGFTKRIKQFNKHSGRQNKLSSVKDRKLDLLLIKEKEKQFANNNKTSNLEENNGEYKLFNSNSNNNIYKEKKNSNRVILRNIDDNSILKLNVNSKDSFIKKKNLNEEINLCINNDYNNKKYNNRLSDKNKAYIGFNKKQTKLSLFEQNKNISLLNNINMGMDGEKIINSKNKNDLTDLKEIINNQIYIKTKNINNINNINNIHNHNKKLASMENINRQKIINKINNCDDNNNSMLLNLKRNATYKRNEINELKSMKDYINKSTDEVHYINNQNNILNKIIVNANQLKNNKNKVEINKNISNNISNINNINNKIIMKSLSNKEKAYYLLTKSKILLLSQRIIFSRATEKIRSLISIKDILKINKLFIKEKIKELEQKISDYNSIIETHFIPSKTAIISLNLIKKEDEDNFKNYLQNNNIKEKQKNYYYKYIELLYILVEDIINEKIFEKIDVNMLYNILNKKGFKNCKDFLYEIFISQKSGKIFDEKKMNKYKELFEQLPDFIKNQDDINKDKFIKFSYFLMHEIYNYWNKLKEFLNLKNQTQCYIEHLKLKISDLK